MNIKFLFKVAALLIATTLVSCAGDEISQAGQQEQLPSTEGMTEFSVVDYPTNAVAARTSGEYTGSSVKFYWTSNDQLWINTTPPTSTLKVSSRSTIPASNGKETSAKFWFEGSYTASSYPVRYTGNGNTMGNKVVIKSEQKQKSPNDGAHIGTDGDCGTATAYRQQNGTYKFMLDHKASYLTFMPYYSSKLDPTFPAGFASSVKLTKIKVSADQFIVGTYDFDDTGILLNTAASTSKSITLTLNEGGENGFEIPTAADYNKNAAIMVVAPGSYTNFTVEYTLYDQITKVTGTVKKNYGSITCNVGKNKKISPDLNVPNYSNAKWTMWDAKHTYWQGHEGAQARIDGQTGTGEPKGHDDPRWYNNSLSAATNLCSNCPNVNEIFWYSQGGDPHWDATKIWCVWGHLYHGGMWILKKAHISGFNSNQWNGHDWRVENGAEVAVYNGPKTEPISDAELHKYFYLPALDNMDEGNWVPVGVWGCYWSSTPTQDPKKAFSLVFSNTVISGQARGKKEGDVIKVFE